MKNGGASERTAAAAGSRAPASLVSVLRFAQRRFLPQRAHCPRRPSVPLSRCSNREWTTALLRRDPNQSAISIAQTIVNASLDADIRTFSQGTLPARTDKMHKRVLEGCHFLQIEE